MMGTTFFGMCFSVQRDTLWIEVPVQRSDIVRSEILLIQPKELKAAKLAMPHIDALLKPTNSNFNEVSTDLACLAET